MSSQLHKRFPVEVVKSILDRYLAKEISAKEARAYLDISRSRLYQLIEEYQYDLDGFSLTYVRESATRKLNPVIEVNLLKELEYEKTHVVENLHVPTRWYNYTYLKQVMQDKHHQSVSVPTIIRKAKENGYWKEKPPKKIHDREVITHYVGELIQHDSSFHLWSPDSNTKWYLITSLDDYSRLILHARFVARDTAWQEILSLQQVFLTYGIPFSYYVDQHPIFRYVKDRDEYSPWREYEKFTGDVQTQWEQVLDDCGVKPIHALSPQAKGKIERPYEWLQDHVVRSCVRGGITDMTAAQSILDHEVAAYNTKKVHSTTGEVPIIRFQNALKEGKSLFREFKLKPVFRSIRDIFCVRIKRTVDSYRYVSVQNYKLRIPKVSPREEVELRLYPDLKWGFVEVRIWHEGEFIQSQKVKFEDLPIVQF